MFLPIEAISIFAVIAGRLFKITKKTHVNLLNRSALMNVGGVGVLERFAIAPLLTDHAHIAHRSLIPLECNTMGAYGGKDYAPTLFQILMIQCATLASFNRFIVPLMKVETREIRHLAAEEAKRRKYKANKEKGCYE